MSGKQKKSYTTGYCYYADMLWAVCTHISELIGVMVGEKVVWKGSVTGSLDHGRIDISQPQIFGGDHAEGGIVAGLVVRDGNSTQLPSPYLTPRFTSMPQPAYRGFVTVEMQHGYFTGPNPYPKSWSFLCKNYSTPWNTNYIQPKINNTVTGCNPAHIIWDILTSHGGKSEFGCHAININEESFLSAATTLYNEGLGLSPIWDGSTSSRDFMLDIINNYINGTLFRHPRTGLWTLKLFRGDYNINDLDTLDSSCITKVNSFVRKGYGDLYSQIIASWTQINNYAITENGGDAETTRTTIVTNLACQNIQGKILSKKISLPHITNYQVAQKIAELNLKQLSYPFAAVELVGNRTLASKMPGDVFLWSWPDYGITKMPLRVIKANYGSLSDNKVTLTCSEDVYGLDFTIFSGLSEVGWVSPATTPVDATYRRLEEIPYHIIINQIYSESDLNALDETSGVMASLIGQPFGTCLSYDQYEYVTSLASYTSRGHRIFTPVGIVNLSISQTDTSINVSNITEPDRVVPGSQYLAIIGSEWILCKAGVVNIAESTASLTIARGIFDTVPANHMGNSQIWFWGWDDYGLCQTVYMSNTTIRIKACPRTATAVLSLSEASENTKIFNARAIRPYPPANIKINGYSFPSAVEDDTPITITWDNRNRINQTGGIFEQNAGNIIPEVNSTVSVYIFDAETDNLIHIDTGLAVEPRSWTYSLATELSDREENIGKAMRAEIETVRDGYSSWQRFTVTIPERSMSIGCLVSNDGFIFTTDAGIKLAYQEI